MLIGHPSSCLHTARKNSMSHPFSFVNRCQERSARTYPSSLLRSFPSSAQHGAISSDVTNTHRCNWTWTCKQRVAVLTVLYANADARSRFLQDLHGAGSRLNGCQGRALHVLVLRIRKQTHFFVHSNSSNGSNILHCWQKRTSSTSPVSFFFSI